jgi:hypothetical protein
MMAQLGYYFSNDLCNLSGILSGRKHEMTQENYPASKSGLVLAKKESII